MRTIRIRDKDWKQILEFLRNHPKVYVGNPEHCRRFIEGVLWINRSGAQWRLLPVGYGKWNSIYKRFARWCDNDIWTELHQCFALDADLECLLIDSTVIRAHPCAAGALPKHGTQEEQALGRSRGGFSTKIHIGVDALGNPLRLILTAGQRSDFTQAVALIAGFAPELIIADKGYDSDEFRQAITTQQAVAVIPNKKSRIEPYDYDHHLYKERHLVECFINKLKHFRRCFSRFDKLASRYLGFLSLSSALIWLR
ncbi:MAG: IS5 family transposase [Chloroflexota bacterium]